MNWVLDHPYIYKILYFKLISKCWKKTKKIFAVLLKLLTSALVNYLQAFIENFIFTSFILLSALVMFSILSIIFCIFFLSSCIMKFLAHQLRWIRKNTSFFRSTSSILYQYIPSLSKLSVLAIKKRTFASFFRYYAFKIHKFIHMVWRKNTNKTFHYIIVVKIFNWFFSLKVQYPLKHFASHRDVPLLSLLPSLLSLI